MSEKIKYINADEWEKVVLKADKVVVDFYSTECPPCEALAAKFEPLSEVYGNDITFVKIMRQDNRELSESLNIKGSPTALFYDNGKQVGDFLTGGIQRKEMVKNLDALLSAEKVKELKAQFKPSTTETDLIVLGGGPGGLTSSIYTSQAKVKTLVIDKGLPGGQVSTTHQVSNYPGFIEPVAGFMLMHYMSQQAVAAGAEFKSAVDVTKVDLEKKEVVIDGLETIKAKRIIVATGASPRALGIKGETEYKGKGISYCATCDAKYYEGKEVIVIGGGNTAIEEALFISKFASKITIIHQFAELQANKLAQEKALADPKINFVLEHEPREFKRNEDSSMSVVMEDLKTKKTSTISAEGIFVFVGMKPNLDELSGQLELDEYGYVKVDKEMKTNIDGVFAVGDVATKQYRQITIAVAEGTIAAINATKGL